MATYRCGSCGVEFEANSTAPTIHLACGGVEVACSRVDIPPEVAERARIRRELLAWLEQDALEAGATPHYLLADRLRAEINRILPEEP